MSQLPFHMAPLLATNSPQSAYPPYWVPLTWNPVGAGRQQPEALAVHSASPNCLPANLLTHPTSSLCLGSPWGQAGSNLKPLLCTLPPQTACLPPLLAASPLTPPCPMLPARRRRQTPTTTNCVARRRARERKTT